MKRLSVFGLLVILPFFVNAQSPNLIPNPGFDSIVNCSPTINTLNCYCWYKTTWGTPDNFNTCFNSPLGAPNNSFGFQQPRSGNGYAGIIVYASNNDREYIGTTLTSSLIAGTEYKVTFYVSLANNSTTAINSIGAYLSNSAMLDSTNHQNIAVSPQIENLDSIITDTVTWVKLQFAYHATGGERYLIIGNFNTNDYTDTVAFTSFPYSYYYIEDVSIEEIDTTGMTEPLTYNSIALNPNPSSGQLWLTGNFPDGTRFKIFNSLGQIVYTAEVSPGNRSEMLTVVLAAGAYCYVVDSNSGILKTGKLILTSN